MADFHGMRVQILKNNRNLRFLLSNKLLITRVLVSSGDSKNLYDQPYSHTMYIYTVFLPCANVYVSPTIFSSSFYTDTSDN